MPHLVRVGSTRDACDRSEVVRFLGHEGDVAVGANERHLVELPAMTTELIWYCGDTRERCANDEPFNWVQCERSGTGAIQWVFYVRQ